MQLNSYQNDSKKWFYVKKNERYGPVDEKDLIYLFCEGELKGETLVWNKNMDYWNKAINVSEFADVILEPPPLPPQTPNINKFDIEREFSNENPICRPWIRYWARMVDITIFSVSLGLFLGIIAPSLLDEIPDTLFGLLILILWVIVEPICLVLFGNTLGKALFKTKIRMKNGSRISFLVALKRSFSLWIAGLGLGIPILSLIFMIKAKSELQNNNSTSWDLNNETIVIHSKISMFRASILTILLISMALLIIWVSQF